MTACMESRETGNEKTSSNEHNQCRMLACIRTRIDAPIRRAVAAAMACMKFGETQNENKVLTGAFRRKTTKCLLRRLVRSPERLKTKRGRPMRNARVCSKGKQHAHTKGRCRCDDLYGVQRNSKRKQVLMGIINAECVRAFERKLVPSNLNVIVSNDGRERRSAVM